jgi:hypothetical protein
VPQPAAAVVAEPESLLAAGVLVEDEELSLLGLAAGAEAPEEPPRKSVTYQPEPLSWKPAAVSCFLKLSWPQAGHTVSTGSEIFWSTSRPCPQDSHL